MESKTENPRDNDSQISLGTKITLAAGLTKQGKYDEAESILKEVIEMHKNAENVTDPAILSAMNNLAAVYSHQDRFAEAETLHRRVLEAEEQTSGDDHSAMIVNMHNLACVLCNQSKFEEAQQLQERAVVLAQKADNGETPSTSTIANSLQNLGNILLRQGKYKEAEPVARKALELYKKVLRENHPDTASSMHNLSVILRKQGKTEEADELKRQEAAMSHDLEKTTNTSDSAEPSLNKGHYDELEFTLQHEIKLSMEASNRNDQEIRQNMNRLGDVLIRNGKYEEAENVLRRALVI